jgi:hypothetical protein
MIDAYQATLIAYQMEHDVGIIHIECAPIRGTNEDWRINDAVMEDLGYVGLMRYSIHEWESQNWEDLPIWVDFDMPGELIDWGPTQNVSWEDRTITDNEGIVHDVSEWVDVACDVCGRRIQ